MAATGRNRLKASSLVEVLVAMTVLLAILAVATTAYLRFAAQRPDRQLRIEQQLARMAADAKSQRDYTPATVELAEWGLKVVRQCSTYRAYPDIVWLSLTAYAPGDRPVAEYRELVLVEDEDEK